MKEKEEERIEKQRKHENEEYRIRNLLKLEKKKMNENFEKKRQELQREFEEKNRELLNKLQSIENEKQIERKKIFISYATTDLKKFNVPIIASELETYPDIERVYFWDRDCNSTDFNSIIDYMEKAIKKSHTILVISSYAANESGPVAQEIDMAVYQKKNLLPIFINIEEVRDILKPKRGLKYDDTNFSKFITDLYNLING